MEWSDWLISDEVLIELLCVAVPVVLFLFLMIFSILINNLVLIVILWWLVQLSNSLFLFFGFLGNFTLVTIGLRLFPGRVPFKI